jgi:hypothetical protein
VPSKQPLIDIEKRAKVSFALVDMTLKNCSIDAYSAGSDSVNIPLSDWLLPRLKIEPPQDGPMVADEDN